VAYYKLKMIAALQQQILSFTLYVDKSVIVAGALRKIF